MSEKLPVKFIYDPDFVPKYFSEGTEADTHAEDYIRDYVLTVSDGWNRKIGPKAIEAATLALTHHYDASPWRHHFTKPPICRIVRSRIATDNYFIEGVSKPLAIWAIPPDKKWQYLPFYARLIHELVHNDNFGIDNFAREILEDDIARELGLGVNIWGIKNQNLRDELVTRRVTHQITEQAFGLDFAQWFSKRESTLENVIAHHEVKSNI